ncbi:ubiquitin-specific protease [Galdieria sulphuraria]|uniref:Ubiquitin-specific protease n=1 Tax=Galdieria sulphuraria TaxID=130081 RepID=M2WA78_GALSU|nr:ubiquitin-specific protease [Galdieria sulphuraria]EME32801.1 ubiquitin-specific protease [Galdieria sulphuraria]|eukprot:XP_005709321.1 ubiquitin-specific protease [Galdieria sulphuraria]
MSAGQTFVLVGNSTSSNKAYGSIPSRKIVPVISSIPIGIENFGNSCHLSAVLVAMSSSNVLKKYLLRHRFQSLDSRLEDLINTLRLVSGQRWMDGHMVKFKVFRPTSVANVLLQQGYNVLLPQDAEETWSKLCQFIENCLRPSKLYGWLSNENVIKGSLFDTCWDSPLFGLEQQKTTCLHCGYYQSIRLEPIRTIRVSLTELNMNQKENSFATLFECLESSLKQPEKLEMPCHRCKCPFLYRYHQVVRLPNVLCIHVERNYWSQKRKRVMKTDQPLLLPKEFYEDIFYNNHWNPLSLLNRQTQYEKNKSSIYELKAVVRHHGTSIYGHYTSAVCVSDWKLDGLYSIVDKYPLSSKHWYLVNDTRVEWIDELQILLSGNIYMCIYEKETL